MSLWALKAPLYSCVRGIPLLHKILHNEKKQLTRLLHMMPRSRLQLDIGSGSGDSLTLFHASRRLLCLDSSFAMLRRAPYPCKLVAHAQHLPFAAATFDLISAIGVLEYVQDETRFLAEVHRTLQPHGFFLFTSSPRVPANFLRLLSGERLYLRNSTQVREALMSGHWRIVAHARTFMQEQWLVQNGSARD